MSIFAFKIFILIIIALAFVIQFTTILDYVQTSRPIFTTNISSVSCPPPPAQQQTTTRSRFKNYRIQNPSLLECRNPYSSWTRTPSPSNHNYSLEAPNSLHKLRINRAVIFYFPIESIDMFAPEFKWVFRSWVNMIEYEPPLWRTDLIVFLAKSIEYKLDEYLFSFEKLGCRFENVRKNATEKPMCILVRYIPISKRNITSTRPKPNLFLTNPDSEPNYQDFLTNVDVFSTDPNDFVDFYRLIKYDLKTYSSYTDSILMAFDGYEYFKKAGYDFLVRSDMDVFFTPLFAKWLPLNCDDFYVGRGGYSNTFNMKRFGRIASNLGLKYAMINNLGSTWYSTPNQFRLVAYLTLFAMAYLSRQEFSQPEREHKLGTRLWPEWHYGVLLLYGQHLALNHLIASQQLNVIKLVNHIDYPSGNNDSIFKMIHIHVFHGEGFFSKSMFKAGRYDQMTEEVKDKAKSNMVAWFACRMALESKYPCEALAKLLEMVNEKKS